MFTSCCPGWIRFVKTQFPHMVKYLSTAKSPQQMFGAVMKTYYAQKLGVDPERIFTVSIMPCVAKKAEREMELFYEEYAGHDVDAVPTTRELVRMIRSAHIRPEGLNDIESDSPMRGGPEPGHLRATGGVMEAALRTAYFALKGKNAPADAFRAVRSLGFNANNGVQEAEFKIDDLVLRTAAVSGLGNTRALLERIDRERSITTSWRSWPAPEAVWAEADSPSTMGRSWPLNGEGSFIIWTPAPDPVFP